MCRKRTENREKDGDRNGSKEEWISGKMEKLGEKVRVA